MTPSTKFGLAAPLRLAQTLALGVQPGGELLFVIEGDAVIVRPRPANLTTVLPGLHADLWPDPEAWLKTERASWE